MSRNEGRAEPTVENVLDNAEEEVSQKGLSLLEQYQSIKEQPQTLEMPILEDEVRLASGGLFYPEGHPWHKRDVVRMKHPTTQEQQILNSMKALKSGQAFNRVLSRLLVDDVDIQTILRGDKNGLLISLRKMIKGDKYRTKITCPNPLCTSVTEHTYNLEEVKYRELSKEALNEKGADIDFSSSPPTVVARLPVSGHLVLVNFLTVGDEVTNSKRAKEREKVDKKHGVDTDKDYSLLFNRIAMLKEVMGLDDRQKIINYAYKMHAGDGDYLDDLYRSVEPSPDMKIDFTCPLCEYESRGLEVPFDTNFFWGERSRDAERDETNTTDDVLRELDFSGGV